MQTLIHLRANLSARQGLERRVAPEAYFANKVRFARATNRKFLFDFMAVPRGVEPPTFGLGNRFSQRYFNHLYQIPEGVTRLGFPNQCRSDSRWRTKEVRHVDSDTIATGF